MNPKTTKYKLLQIRTDIYISFTMFPYPSSGRKCSTTDCCCCCSSMWIALLVALSVTLFWLTHTYINEECVVLQMENCTFIYNAATDKNHPQFNFDILVIPADCESQQHKVVSLMISGIAFEDYNKNCSSYFEREIYPKKTIACYWMEYDSPCDVTITSPIQPKSKDEPDDVRQITLCIVFMVLSLLFAIASLSVVIVREFGGKHPYIRVLCRRKKNSYSELN